ncbi:MAG TPA: glutathione binding-like protein [Kofleriaceae bacterium]|jgi:glutathione S-transferase
MKLYGHPLSSCTRKALLVAAEKQTTLDFALVDLFVGAHHAPEYLARHPFGVIPMLEDGDFTLYESRAIAKYLDAVLPGPSLIPTAPRARARMEQWLSCDASYVAPHTRALAHQLIVRPHMGQSSDAAAIHAGQEAVARAFGVFDKHLASSTYLVDDALSLADVSLAPYVASLAMLNATHLLETTPHLRRWWQTVSARAGWELLTAR